MLALTGYSDDLQRCSSKMRRGFAHKRQAGFGKKNSLALTTPYATHTKTNSQMELYKEMYACSPGPLVGGFNRFSKRPGSLQTTTGFEHSQLCILTLWLSNSVVALQCDKHSCLGRAMQCNATSKGADAVF